MNLVIDIGNSSAKAGCFAPGALRGTYRRVDHDALLPFVQSLKPSRILFASVAGETEKWRAGLALWADSILPLDHRLPLPFENHYQTPQTLGADRLAAVAGAQALYPGRTCLTLDAGTCLKYEWLEHGRHYLGGSISPGLQMRFRAMHAFTSRLPLLEPDATAPLTGTSTHGAMQSGVLNGMAAEIEGIIGQYLAQDTGAAVILTGGDAHFFERRLKTPIFAVSDLVLVGLNHILNFNT